MGNLANNKTKKQIDSLLARHDTHAPKKTQTESDRCARRWSNFRSKSQQESGTVVRKLRIFFLVFFFFSDGQNKLHLTSELHIEKESNWKGVWSRLNLLYATREDFRWAEGWDLCESKRWPSKSCYMPGGSRKQAGSQPNQPPLPNSSQSDAA